MPNFLPITLTVETVQPLPKLALGVRGISDFRANPERFAAHVCHSQTVVRLPEGAVKLAWNGFEPCQL